MGAICSRNSTVENAPGGPITHVTGQYNHGSGLVYESPKLKINSTDATSPSGENAGNEQLREPFSLPEVNLVLTGASPDKIDDGSPRPSLSLFNERGSANSSQAAVVRVSEVSSLLGRARTAGREKAIELLDLLGASMSSFTSGVTINEKKISILAFELAKTIVKGSILLQSLSRENIRHLKEVVLRSEGVQNLISTDMDHLLRIVAADKRQELDVFSREVARFGNHCKDPQWHNLDRYFNKLRSQLPPQRPLRKVAETVMQQLMTLVQYTAELYHELCALDRSEQDYRHKLEEDDNSNAAQRRDSLMTLRVELKSQRKHVRSLKKKSLWSEILEEVVEKLVDIVHFLFLEVHEVFEGLEFQAFCEGSPSNNKTLGSAGLALHYANIITQIDTLVSQSSSVPQNARDALYQRLPPHIKSNLRSRLTWLFQVEEKLTVSLIRAELDKTLQWLVPVATNTTKFEVNRKPAGQRCFLRIETLHHADKQKTEAYILELLVWLHCLVSQVRIGNSRIRSPMLTVVDEEMLQGVSRQHKTTGISKSLEFATGKTSLSKHHRLSKSSGHSPMSESEKNPDNRPVKAKNVEKTYASHKIGS